MRLMIKFLLSICFSLALLYILQFLFIGTQFEHYPATITNILNEKIGNGTITLVKAAHQLYMKFSTMKSKMKNSGLGFAPRNESEKQFIATRQQLFPRDLSFTSSEMGDCVNNGDVEMKSLSPSCGCPLDTSSMAVHRCCQIHLIKMLKDVYSEMMKSDIPLILTRGAVIGWNRDKRLIPTDEDIQASLPYASWNSPRYTNVLKRLASRGYCVWFRESTWTKIWSSIMAFDIRPWSIVENELYFAGTGEGHSELNPYNVSHILPKRLAVLEGMNVYIPNKPKEYLDHLSGKGLKTFNATRQNLFPPERLFRPSEIGDCINNGDSKMKSLNATCGCPPEKDSVNVHPCCRRHLLKLLRDVFNEIIKADIPMILTGGAVIGWHRNKTLIPYDFDIDASLLYEHWHAPQYTDVLKRLASRGYCVWFRETTWTKIWSSVMAFDIFALSIVESELYFYSPVDVHNPFNMSTVFPKRLAVLEGYKVYLPNRPTDYLDQVYGKGAWMKPLH